MWPFKKDKKYIHGSVPFSEPHTKINQMINEWLIKNPDIIPVSISMCPSGISGITFGIIIYKQEVKSE